MFVTVGHHTISQIIIETWFTLLVSLQHVFIKQHGGNVMYEALTLSQPVRESSPI